jgi:hypothetical protein
MVSSAAEFLFEFFAIPETPSADAALIAGLGGCDVKVLRGETVHSPDCDDRKYLTGDKACSDQNENSGD